MYQDHINIFIDINVFYRFGYQFLAPVCYKLRYRYKYQYFMGDGFHHYMRFIKGLKMGQKVALSFNTIFSLFVLSSGPSHGTDHC